MKVAHVIRLNQWYREGDNSGSTSSYIVIDEGTVSQVPAGSPVCKSTMRRRWPNRIEHNVTLNEHRGFIEQTAEVLQFRIAYPQLFKMLSFRFKFEKKYSDFGSMARTKLGICAEFIYDLSDLANTATNPAERAVLQSFLEAANVIDSWRVTR